MKSRFTVKHRRRREGKTNYSKRLKLLSSGKNIIIFRKLSRILVGQIIRFEPIGDAVLASVNSKELEKYGWMLNKKNLPCAYLTGYLLAKKAAGKKVGELVVNFGIINPSKGSSNYSFLKGAIDGGLKIAHSEDLFPEEKRIKGEHISSHSKAKDAKNTLKIFDETKKKIESAK